MFKHGGGRYDNQTPSQQAELDGWGARARAAHYNTLEAFPIFATGFLAAQLGAAMRLGCIYCASPGSSVEWRIFGPTFRM